MRLLPLLTLSCAFIGAFSSAVLAQPNDAPPAANLPRVPPALTPPALRAPRGGTAKEQIEDDMKGFFNALNVLAPTPISYDIPSYISDARIGYFGLNEWTNFFIATWGKVQFRLDKIEIETVEDDKARVKVTYGWVSTKTDPPLGGRLAHTETLTDIETETLDLKREVVTWVADKPEKWRIVPPSFEQRGSSLSLGHIAYYASQRPGTWSQLRAEISMDRLKNLSLGALQFTQDYDEQFLFQNEFWRDALTPYVGNDSIFLIPGTQTPYTFNDQLSDKNLAAIKEIAQTVLFYEGENERPIFRYNGQAAICFADGHVKLVSPEVAKSLIWKP